MLATTVSQKEFSTWLVEQLPKNITATYHEMGVPMSCNAGEEETAVPFYMHCSDFSYTDASSLREPTMLKTSKDLLEQMAVDGFVTSSEPVFVRFVTCWNLWLVLCAVRL
jgi:hypothetical protein